MAWQLIYTSSPKLLQAGRTGFGTVAKHTTLRPGVVSELERCSQFSRAEGLDPDRVLFYHRTLSSGGEQYHVLSRVRDDGADYTGRTNHIAHHIVFSASEAAELTAEGITPADAILWLCRQSLWVDSWHNEPCEFGPEQEIPAGNIQASLQLPARYWESSTGRAANAAILAPGRVGEACWILHPGDSEARLLPLFGEALLLHPAPWRVSFASDLQPTDRQEEIAWRGITSASPLREAASQSVRPTLDLHDPESLPPPSPEFTHLAEYGAQEPISPVQPLPAPSAISAPGSSQESPTPSPSSGERIAVAAHKPSLSRLKSTRSAAASRSSAPGSKAPLVVALLLALLLISGAGAYFLTKYNRQVAVGEFNAQFEELKRACVPHLTGSGLSESVTDVPALKRGTEGLKEITGEISKLEFSNAIKRSEELSKKFGRDAVSGELLSFFPDLSDKLKKHQKERIYKLLAAGEIDEAVKVDMSTLDEGNLAVLLREIQAAIDAEKKELESREILERIAGISNAAKHATKLDDVADKSKLDEWLTAKGKVFSGKYLNRQNENTFSDSAENFSQKFPDPIFKGLERFSAFAEAGRQFSSSSLSEDAFIGVAGAVPKWFLQSQQLEPEATASEMSSSVPSLDSGPVVQPPSTKVLSWRIFESPEQCKTYIEKEKRPELPLIEVNNLHVPIKPPFGKVVEWRPAHWKAITAKQLVLETEKRYEVLLVKNTGVSETGISFLLEAGIEFSEGKQEVKISPEFFSAVERFFEGESPVPIESTIVKYRLNEIRGPSVIDRGTLHIDLNPDTKVAKSKKPTDKSATKEEIENEKKKANLFAQEVLTDSKKAWSTEYVQGEVKSLLKIEAEKLKTRASNSNQRKPIEDLEFAVSVIGRAGESLSAALTKIRQKEGFLQLELKHQNALSAEQISIVEGIMKLEDEFDLIAAPTPTPTPPRKITSEEFFQNFSIGIYKGGDKSPIISFSFKP